MAKRTRNINQFAEAEAEWGERRQDKDGGPFDDRVGTHEFPCILLDALLDAILFGGTTDLQEVRGCTIESVEQRIWWPRHAGETGRRTGNPRLLERRGTRRRHRRRRGRYENRQTDPGKADRGRPGRRGVSRSPFRSERREERSVPKAS